MRLTKLITMPFKKGVLVVRFTEAQRGQVTCPKSHSQEGTGWGWNQGLSGSRIHALPLPRLPYRKPARSCDPEAGSCHGCVLLRRVTLEVSLQ